MGQNISFRRYIISLSIYPYRTVS